LTIQVLNTALGLLHLAVRLGLGVAGGAAKSLLDFSTQILAGSTQAIVVHRMTPMAV
jgi:hypothetical protein